MRAMPLAGATGYLGSAIAKELTAQSIHYRAIARDRAKLARLGVKADDVVIAELPDSSSIERCCSGIDTVISTVGITRQKDKLTYRDVDYQANLNLLEQALKSGVRRFLHVSVLKWEKLRHLALCEAKERFVDRLRDSGID